MRFEGQISRFSSADFRCAYFKYRVPHLEFYIRGTISATVLRENEFEIILCLWEKNDCQNSGDSYPIGLDILLFQIF